MKAPALHIQIFIALALAVILGSLTNEQTELFGVVIHDILDFFGKLFLNALKMIVVPLIFSSIIVGVTGVAAKNNFARMGVKIMVYYVFTSTVSILVGLMLVNLIQPGLIDDGLAKLGDLSAEHDAVVRSLEKQEETSLFGIFLRMIPTNIVLAAAEGQLLGIIFFAAVFGIFLARLKAKLRSPMLNFWTAFNETMMKITLWIIKFSPYGVFALVGKVVMTSGLGVFVLLLQFFLTVLGGLAIHFLIVLPLILYLVAGVNPYLYLRAMMPAVLMAFSTASSSSTLPLTINCARNRVKASKEASSFVLPLGATINMDGTALYECVAVIFIAQMYGVDLSFTAQFTIVVLALMTSIGVAGVPAASLVAITLILTALQLPMEGIALILAVDRVLDMCRTSVNVYSDSTAVAVLARNEPLRPVRA
ncbi:MAG: dicarboxylate/amino acid:cation symporter [Chromatiales bacterium]|nr:dicarboxylate/amino acid:cation symporter [Chromatiales bacterium]